MKHLHKALALILTLAMVMSLGITAFAAAPAPSDYSITITNDPAKSNVSIVKQTYKAYKLFDVTYAEMPNPPAADAAYSYTVAEKYKNIQIQLTADMAVAPDFAEGTALNADNIIKYVANLKSDSDKLNAFAKAVYEYINTNTIAEDATGIGAKAANGKEKAVINCTDAGPGYYLVFGGAKATDAGATADLTSALILDTTNPRPIITAKVDAPTLEKKVEDHDNTCAGVGDTVTFTLKSKVPNMTGFTTYKMTFKDQMSNGLTLNDDIKVLVGGKDVTGDANIKITKSCTAKGAFTIEILDAKKYNTGDEILITYSATVNSNAVNNAQDKNKATLDYSNDPSQSDSFATTPEKITEVYDFNVDVLKHNEDKKPLSNAIFALYKEVNGAKNYYKWGNGTVQWNEVKAENPARADLNGKATMLITGDDGKLHELKTVDGKDVIGNPCNFKGLDAGTYYLYEVEAPDGYNKLDKAIKVEIKEIKDTAGNVTSVQFVVNGKNVGDPMDPSKADAQIVMTADVLNKSGNELPSTGGIGTTIFYTVGAIMMVSALVLLITKKKMSAN